MEVPISYENIDLFYYHSIDYDFARFSSILEYGIVSSAAYKEKHLKYYYRNYTHSSAREEYISVSHFPRTVLQYYKIENELYDFNTNKICFILDLEDNKVLKKQACRNREKYTNERHVHYEISPSEIKGILLRESDAKKRISEVEFNYKFTDKSYFENKVFTIINFFQENFKTFGDCEIIYFLIGKLREARVLGKEEEPILERISRQMRNNITMVFSTLLQKEDPTLLEIITFFNQGKYPIYLMNRFDIKPVGENLAQTDERLEIFKENKELYSRMKEKSKLDKKTLKLVKKMTPYGMDIFYGYSMGPLTKEDTEIGEEIKRLTLKK